MKKPLFILSLFILFLCVTFFSQAQKPIEVARVFHEKNWRYINKKGEFLFPKPTIDVCFSEGLAVVKEGKKVGFMNFKGKFSLSIVKSGGRV